MTTMTMAPPVTSPVAPIAEILFDCGPAPIDQATVDALGTLPYVERVSQKAPPEGKEGSYILVVQVDVKTWAKLTEVELNSNEDGKVALDRQTMLHISACIAGRPYRKPDTYQAELAGRPDHQVVLSEDPGDDREEFDPDLD